MSEDPLWHDDFYNSSIFKTYRILEWSLLIIVVVCKDRRDCSIYCDLEMIATLIALFNNFFNFPITQKLFSP